MSEESRSLAAVALVTRKVDGKMLVVWNRRYGGWTMPGGKVEDGEEPVAACVRELFEETGIATHAGACVEVYDGPVHAVIDGELQAGRGRHCHVFLVQDPFGVAFERESGCPVSWFAREEFLRWSPFSRFYEAAFPVIDEAVRARAER